jgi:hypothetical protein
MATPDRASYSLDIVEGTLTVPIATNHYQGCRYDLIHCPRSGSTSSHRAVLR